MYKVPLKVMFNYNREREFLLHRYVDVDAINNLFQNLIDKIY